MNESINFCFPARELSSERVKLTPFLLKHVEEFWDQAKDHPELFAHMPMGPFSSAAHFAKTYLEGYAFSNPGVQLYAIIDKTKPPKDAAVDPDGPVAGHLALMNSSATDLQTEIGAVVCLPEFQKTHVTTNAVGLLLQYALEPPAKGGLGLRRVVWRASSANAQSLKTAARFGFQKEGVLRWDRVFRKSLGKVGNGKGVPPGSDPDLIARDTVVLSLCWDDWEDGARERIAEMLQRE